MENFAAVGSLLCQEDDNVPVDDDLIAAMLAGRVPRRHTPVSEHLFTFLAPVFADQFGTNEDYAAAFDRVEVLLDAVAADARANIPGFYAGRWGYGRYTWRNPYANPQPEQQMLNEAEKAGAGWSSLLGGFFGGDTERAITALTAVVADAKRIRQERW